MDRPGGIFLRSADLIPAEDLTLLRAVASVVMVAARGTLPQQLGVPLEAPDLPGPLARKRDPRDPSAALPFMELPYFNSLGGFTPDGREYAIYLGPGMNTPAPWVNVIANPDLRHARQRNRGRIHLAGQQPAQPPDAMVERSGDGSAVGSALHPG